ncbi:MAG TPA: DUF4962 domain-containing protein [Thermoanaerobaculia bacterium]|nr:DUF4962 domain-containing protein [Thermoanaerobaculia bacterium]
MIVAALVFAASLQTQPPPFAELLAKPVRLKPQLEGVHPRVFVTAEEIEALRQRARTTHREEWSRVIANLAALKGEPPKPPGPQERRAQNTVAYAIAEVSLAYAIERKPEYLDAARRWTLAAIDYEPWGYTYNLPNTDLAAGHLLYAIGWAYDLLFHDLTEAERQRIRSSLERHADLVYDYFAAKKKLNFTQNHDFITTSGLGIAALALYGESKNAPQWAALARAHHHRAGQLLSPDGHYYEGFEYWTFSAPWLVHFLDAWEHSTGESLWDREVFRNWKLYVAHSVLPDGQTVVDFGDIWEGPLTRLHKGADYPRVYPDGRLRSNYNILYRVAARLRDPETQAVAERLRAFGQSNHEEYWTLIWRDPSLEAAPMTRIPLRHHFEDSGVAYIRTSWDKDATVLAFKAGPPEGHRALALQPKVPEWRQSTGHAHPDANSFIFWAAGRYLTGDTGYSGMSRARNHNTITVGGVGQGIEGKHDVWAGVPRESLDRIRIVEVNQTRIIGEAAGAYPKEAALERYRREVILGPKGTLQIRDRIETREAKKVEWHLNADTPLQKTSNGFATDAMEVIAHPPSGATFEMRPTLVKVPGLPGSLTEGPIEERGDQLVITAPPATKFEFETTLTSSLSRNAGEGGAKRGHLLPRSAGEKALSKEKP